MKNVTSLIGLGLCLTAFAIALAVFSEATPSRGQDYVEKVVFHTNRTGNYEVFMMNPDGSEQVNLTNNPANDEYPSISPFGDEIYFDSDRSGDYEIYAMSVDGSNVTRLTFSPGDDKMPSLSPNGETIVFWSNRDGDSEIYTMDYDGSNQTPLTNNASGDASPSWSPDGSEIAFESNRDGDWDIFVMSADGQSPFNLSFTDDSEGSPSWSPDGFRVAFDTNRDGDSEIYTMDSFFGEDQTNISFAFGDDYSPVFSPDGSQIAFHSSRDGGLFDIYVMDANGENMVQLTESPATDAWADWGYILEETEPVGLIIEDQLGDCLNAVNSAWTLNYITKEWLGFQPGAPDFLQELRELQSGGGYLVNVAYDCFFEDGTNHVTLTAGWKLFGWR